MKWKQLGMIFRLQIEEKIQFNLNLKIDLKDNMLRMSIMQNVTNDF